MPHFCQIIDGGKTDQCVFDNVNVGNSARFEGANLTAEQIAFVKTDPNAAGELILNGSIDTTQTSHAYAFASDTCQIQGEEMTKSFRSPQRWLAITSLSVLLAACYALAGLDMSVEGRHKMWVEDKGLLVGKNVYGCAYCYCIDHQRLDLYLGEFELGNGNKERGFRYGRFEAQNPNRFPQCRYFYEYDPKLA